MVNGPRTGWFIEKQGPSAGFQGVSHRAGAIPNGRRQDIPRPSPGTTSRNRSPFFEFPRAAAPDGAASAVHPPPCSLGGVRLTIRKFHTSATFENGGSEIREGTPSTAALGKPPRDYVLARKNVLICGWNRQLKIDPYFRSGEIHSARGNAWARLSRTRPKLHCPQQNLVPPLKHSREQNGLPASGHPRNLLKVGPPRHRPDA